MADPPIAILSNAVWILMILPSKCKNSLLVPFIKGTEPKIVPDVRKKCFNKSRRATESVLDKLKEVFEGGEG